MKKYILLIVREINADIWSHTLHKTMRGVVEELRRILEGEDKDQIQRAIANIKKREDFGTDNYVGWVEDIEEPEEE